jgi:hypothetical protein
MINDIKLIKSSYGVEVFNAEDLTAASLTVSMKPGEVVKRGGTGGNFVVPVLDGDGEQGTDILVGVVTKESTETATVDGVVEVNLIGPGTMLEGKATTAANIDTAAKLLAIQGDYVAFDVTALAQTIDEDEGDDPNVHALFIVNGDIVKGTLRVLVASAMLFGSTV